MHKITFLLICLISIASIASTYAQNKSIELKKNPFSQPDFLKYRPPVKIRVEKEVIKKEVPEFILTATFISVNEPMAVVNDTLISKGDEVDGIRLIMVSEDRVKIRYEGETYEIFIIEKPVSKNQIIRRNVVK